MIRSLILIHLAEEGWHGRSVDKPNIPIFFIVKAGPQAELLCDLMDDFVLRVVDMDDQRWIVCLLLHLQFLRRLDCIRRR